VICGRPAARFSCCRTTAASDVSELQGNSYRSLKYRGGFFGYYLGRQIDIVDVHLPTSGIKESVALQSET
jgi:hypothetical protein